MVDIQVLPLFPISKVLFSDVEYVKKLVGLGMLGLGKVAKSLRMLCREFLIRKVLWRFIE